MRWLPIGLAIWLVLMTPAQADTFDDCTACEASILNTPKAGSAACSTVCSEWFGTSRYREWVKKWMREHPRPQSIREQWMETHSPRQQLIRPPICEIAIVKEVYPAAESCRSGEEAQGSHGNTADGDYWSCSGAGAGGITYTDGIHQNGGYAYVPAMEDSRPGDRVKLCLVSREIDCPPGDDRGTVYTALNLRTHGRWRKPNSEHNCGGA